MQPHLRRPPDLNLFRLFSTHTSTPLPLNPSQHSPSRSEHHHHHPSWSPTPNTLSLSLLRRRDEEAEEDEADMVSTRRSGSLSRNTSKRSSSSEDKPLSPKRQKAENDVSSKKSAPAENSKEMCSPAAVDPPECGLVDPPTAGVGEAVSLGKGDAAQAVAVATPIADGSSPVVVDKPRSSFSSWSTYQKQNLSFESSTPWCRLLSQYGQNSNGALTSFQNSKYGQAFVASGKKQLTMNVAIVVILIVVVAAILVTCPSLIFWFTKKTSTYKSIFFWRKSTMADDNVEAFLKINGSLVPQRYSYSRIKKVTNSFQVKLGKGGYGDVYKGKLLDGRLVAVKLLNETKGSNGEEFINEVASISRTSHVNIVSLVGYCFEGHKRALIYEYMPNGSLEKFIYNNKSQKTNNDLEWKTMHKIAVGIARGLEYLHRGCTTRIFHFDIKPHNILLDEDFCPKISDFGLAKLCSKKESIVSMLHARGTIGYIAPEVFSRNFGRVSHKADIYSYGMLVLEMVHGRENIGESVEHTSDLYFPHSIYKKLECDGDIGLHGIESEEDEKVARKMILVGLCCIQSNPSNRPAINKVIEMLEGNLESLQIPPEPFLSSPSRTPITSSIIQILEENESCEVESM
ncbi:unnamed protein product [Camellia sinensis]